MASHSMIPSTKPHLFNQQSQIQALVKTIDEESDDLESVDSNPAKFSDEEMVDQTNQAPPSGMEYDPFSTMNQAAWGSQTEYGQVYMPPRNINYNPYEVLEQRSGRFNQKKSQEPIMYDPTKIKSRNPREKNQAPAGSLLKIWEGSIEMEKDNAFLCQFYSTQDIQNFQILPDLPSLMTLKGKAKISDVINHFLRLRRDKRLIRGWVVRKNAHYQENNDKYTRLFDDLEAQQKSIIFNIFSGVTLYLIPYTKKHQDFFKQMNVITQPVYQGDGQPRDSFYLDNYSQEETHCFAFFSQIKQNFSSKVSYLNPEVIRIQYQSQGDSQSKQKDQSFSPITSDEEDNKVQQTQKQLLQTVKQEEQMEDIQSIVKTQEMPPAPYPVVKAQPSLIPPQQEEEDDDIDIEGLIQKFKNREYDIQSIQEKLVPIIHKVKGQKEKRLTEFLSELIQSYNNPYPPTQVKQETVMGDQMMSQQQIPPYGQPQPRYQGNVPQGQSRYGMQYQGGNQYQNYPPMSQNQPPSYYRPPLSGTQPQFQQQSPLPGQNPQFRNQFQGQYPQGFNPGQNPQQGIPQLRPPPAHGQVPQQQFRPGQGQQYGQQPPYQQQPYPNQK